MSGRHRRFGLAICLFLLILPPPRNAAAAPVISSAIGTLADGRNVVLSGTGFGSTGPQIVVFDDFEGGIPGATVKTGPGSASLGEWNYTEDLPRPYYTDTTAVSGRLAFQADQSLHWSVPIMAILPEPTVDIFISWWLYMPPGNNWPGELSSDLINWKQMWILGANSRDDDLVVPTFFGAGSWCINGNASPYQKWVTIPFSKGEWKRLWISIKGGYARDGHVEYWELTPSGVRQVVDDRDVTTLMAGGLYERVHVNGYGRQTTNSHPTFDDVYIAAGPSAPARVEIGSHPTYGASTKLALGTATAWSDEQISFTFHQGSFATGEPAYLFVFDSNGIPSAGYPVVVGSYSDGDPPPMAPRGLRIP